MNRMHVESIRDSILGTFKSLACLTVRPGEDELVEQCVAGEITEGVFVIRIVNLYEKLEEEEYENE